MAFSARSLSSAGICDATCAAAAHEAEQAATRTAASHAQRCARIEVQHVCTRFLS